MSKYDDAYFDRIEQRWAEDAADAREREAHELEPARITWSGILSGVLVVLAFVGMFILGGIPLQFY